ncbi:hypothetical protein [Telluribacter sp.]|jgi:hypothetical protein|uniref:hypothetical protein n=1 Tax=Telluribacter sp. TaxID=1978767 RepID=UPI002E146CFD|nr:hypothetical protein [Telluribacter sp.]
MKVLILMFGLLAWVSCQENEVPLENVVETEATIVSNLAADGCDWHIEVQPGKEANFQNYVPTKATESKVKAAVPEWKTQNSYSFTPITIKYRATSGTQKVQCGWGKTGEFTEIEVLEIKKK